MSISFLPNIKCPRGLPDCDPPKSLAYIYGSLAMLILLYLSDMIFYSVFADTFSDDGMRETPIFMNLLIGYLLAVVLFIITYVYFGRPPSSGETVENHRSRNHKGLVFGFSVGSLVFIPAVFIMSSVVLDYNLGVQLLDAIYHTIQLSVAGIIVAHLLGTPPSE